jgi:hypothetical protein
MPAAPGFPTIPPSHALGRKLDSIPFSAYHLVLIVVLGFAGFIEGSDLALSGSLLVLAKVPLHLAPEEVRTLAVCRLLSSCSAGSQRRRCPIGSAASR